MRIRKKISSLVIFLMVFGLVLAGCGSGGSGSGDAGDTGGKIDITFATGGVGGPMHTIGSAICTVWTDSLENVNATNSSTASSVVNCNMVNEGKAQIAFTMSDVAYLGYKGEEMFKESLDNMYGLISLHTNYVQLITKKGSGIKSVYDLKGKRVGVGAPGSGTEFNARCILEAAGMSYKDLAKADYLSYAETCDQLANDNIDAGFLTGGLPIAAISELSTTHDIEIFPIDSEIIEKLNDIYPIYFEDNIPGDLYRGVTEPIPTAALKNYLIINADVDEELTYNLLQAMVDNWDLIQQSHSGMKNITPEMGLERMEIPIHPGAEKFFKEIGILE